MVYTVGKTVEYESYLMRTPNLKKAKGGSVWPTCLSAMKYLYDTKQQDEFSIYYVEADWEKHCRKVTKSDNWRALRMDAPIRRVDERELQEALEAVLYKELLLKFTALSPWIMRITYDDDDKIVRTEYCRFCAHTRPGHYNKRSYSGPPCPLEEASEVLYFGQQKKVKPEERSTTDPTEVVQPATRS